MRGDFSRIRFNREKGYTAVLEQQGRVALDADANEQCFIDGYLRSAQTTDVIGSFGGPIDDCGFAITVTGGEITIGPGRYYVAGLECENPGVLPYDGQPHLLNPTASGADLLAELEAAGGAAVIQVYLEVWQRFVTGLDDACLLEPALGRADTTGRLQTVWRVVASLQNPAPTPSAAPSGALTSCCQAMYERDLVMRTGAMTAGTSGPSSDCGCEPIPAAGYQGVENQLYRVEIHQGGNGSTATFKWSRENGSVVSAVTAVSGSTLQVTSLPPDANLGFQTQGWVECGDDTSLFGQTPNQPGSLFQVQSIQPGDPSLTVDGTVAVNPAENARVRRWDQSGPSASASGVPIAAGSWIALENGIQVQFAEGEYAAGDYWTIPARAATGTIEWPPCGSDGSSFQPPESIRVTAAPLGCIHWAPIRLAAELLETRALPEGRALLEGRATSQPVLLGRFSVDDCRLQFSPLTTLTAPRAQPIHVESVNWINDDVTTLDRLVANGLTAQLDQVIASPVTGGSFIVTIEAVEAPEDSDFVAGQSAPATPLRTITIADSTIAVTTQTLASGASGSLLNWQLPFTAEKSRMQILAVEAIRDLITPGATLGLYARVRIKLLGEMIFADGASGLSYLDGRALGQLGTASGGGQRIDLRLPSGQGATSSDLDGWFYLAPALEIDSLTTNASAYTVVVDFANDVTSVQATVSGTVETITPQATIELSNPPVAVSAGTLVNLSLSISSSSAGGTLPSVASMASVPTTVQITAGEASQPPIAISIVGNPGAGTTLTFELSASMTLEGDFSAYASTTFTVTGAAPPTLIPIKIGTTAPLT